MAVSEDYKAYVEDQLSEFPEYSSKKMFGGVGFFRDGAMFGAIMDNVFRLKADESTIEKYTSQGMGPHEIPSRKMTMPYYEVPQDVLENRSELKKWAEEALEVALKSKKKK